MTVASDGPPERPRAHRRQLQEVSAFHLHFEHATVSCGVQDLTNARLSFAMNLRSRDRVRRLAYIFCARPTPGLDDLESHHGYSK